MSKTRRIRSSAAGSRFFCCVLLSVGLVTFLLSLARKDLRVARWSVHGVGVATRDDTLLLRVARRTPVEPWWREQGVRGKAYKLGGREKMVHHREEKYFLAAVIFNRVFAADKFNITNAECVQWLEYLRYAGVEHVFWYDTAKSDAESQEDDLKPYVASGFLTYHRWQRLFPGRENAKYNEEQDRSYDHCLTQYGTLAHWMLECDIDEYPFKVDDLAPTFLARTLRAAEARQPQVSQWLMQCLIFVGNGDNSKKILIERYQRRRMATEGNVTAWLHKMKPIIRPTEWLHIQHHDPHKLVMATGDTAVFSDKELHFNHYWGGRVNNWGPDRPEDLEHSVLDSSIQPIVEHLRGVLSPQHGGNARNTQELSQ